MHSFLDNAFFSPSPPEGTSDLLPRQRDPQTTRCTFRLFSCSVKFVRMKQGDNEVMRKGLSNLTTLSHSDYLYKGPSVTLAIEFLVFTYK